jgi:ACR3 family arsenite transporter
VLFYDASQGRVGQATVFLAGQEYFLRHLFGTNSGFYNWLKTIALVILIPLILGVITYHYLLKRFSQEYFQKLIKPYLPAASAWGIMPIIFISISLNAPKIASRLEIFALAFIVQLIFYAVNYMIAVFIGRKMFEERDGLALVFSTVLRNLSIAMGLAAIAFGPNAALMVSLAFLIQGQAAAGFIKLNKKYGLLKRKESNVS